MPVPGLTSNSIKRAFEAPSPIDAVGNYDKKFATLVLQFMAVLAGCVGAIAMEYFWHKNCDAKINGLLDITDELIEKLPESDADTGPIKINLDNNTYLRLQQIKEQNEIKVIATTVCKATNQEIESSKLNTSFTRMRTNLGLDIINNPEKYHDITTETRQLAEAISVQQTVFQEDIPHIDDLDDPEHELRIIQQQGSIAYTEAHKNERQQLSTPVAQLLYTVIETGCNFARILENTSTTMTLELPGKNKLLVQQIDNQDILEISLKVIDESGSIRASHHVDLTFHELRGRLIDDVLATPAHGNVADIDRKLAAVDFLRGITDYHSDRILTTSSKVGAMNYPVILKLTLLEATCNGFNSKVTNQVIDEIISEKMLENFE